MMPVVGSHVDHLMSLKDIHEVKCSVDLVQMVGIWNAITKEEDGGDQLGFIKFPRHCAEQQTALRHLGRHLGLVYEREVVDDVN